MVRKARIHRREKASTRALLFVLLSFLASPAEHVAASHEGAACGLPVREDPFGHQEFTDIGNRFFVRNVRIAPHPQGVFVTGQIDNHRQDFFTFALFKVQLFDAACTYLGANNFAIDSFELGITRPFRVIVPRVRYATVATYHIEFLP